MKHITLFKLDEIRGNSKFPGHWEDIEVDHYSVPSWNWNQNLGNGVGVGLPKTVNVMVQLVLPKSEIDAANHLLFSSTTDEVFEKGEINLLRLKNGIANLNYLKFKMSGVVIDAVHYDPYSDISMVLLTAAKTESIYPSLLER